MCLQYFLKPVCLTLIGTSVQVYTSIRTLVYMKCCLKSKFLHSLSEPLNIPGVINERRRRQGIVMYACVCVCVCVCHSVLSEIAIAKLKQLLLCTSHIEKNWRGGVKSNGIVCKRTMHTVYMGVMMIIQCHTKPFSSFIVQAIVIECTMHDGTCEVIISVRKRTGKHHTFYFIQYQH